MLTDNNGNIKPIVWVITIAALGGAIFVSGNKGGSRGGRGQDGVYVERSMSPCPTKPCPPKGRRNQDAEAASYGDGY